MLREITHTKQRNRKFTGNHGLTNITTIKQIFLILLLFATISQTLNIKELDVSANTYVIDTLADYTIIYDRTQQNYGITNDINTNPVPAGTTLTLTVPSVYTLDQTLSISATVNEGAATFPDFTISSNIITVNGLFPTQAIVSTVTLVIQNLRNPSPAITTDAFFGYIGVDYAEPIFLKSVIVLQPAQFQSCYMTFRPKFVNRISSMVFTIVARTQIPSTGGLLVQFPSNIWSQGAVISTTNNLPITNLMSCSNLSQNVKLTLQCNGIQNQNRISITNMFSSTINAGDSFSFEVNNFLSPPSNRPADLIRILSQDSSSNTIDTCQEYVTDLIPNQMLSSKITITNGGLPLTVNQQYTIRFMFETVDTFNLNDYFEIEFPPESIFSFNPNTLSGGITLVRPNATYSTSILRCYMNPLLSVKNYVAPFIMFISVGTYTAPPSIQPTSNFKITILRNGFPMQVGYQSLTSVFTTLAGSLTQRENQVVNQITSYTFSITINDPLSSNGKIRIRLPSQVQIESSSTDCAQLTGTNMIQSPSCVINALSKTIQLTSINSSSALIPAQTFTVVVNNLKNPSSTTPTSAFEVRSFYRSTDGSLVAVGSVAGFSSKQATIDASDVQIQSSSYRVLEQGATYTFRLNVENDIGIGGSFNLFVPKPILVNIAVLTSSCKRGVNTVTTTTTPCNLISQDGTGYLIKFTNPLAASSVTKGQFIILQLNGIVTNSPSTSPVSTFKLQTYAASGFIIAKIQQSLSIQMIEPTVIASATYSRDSSQNYQLTTYQFTIKQIPVMEIGSVILVQFPASIIPSVSSTCGMTAPFVNPDLTCALNTPTTIRITLPSSIPISSNTPLTLTVSNIRNPTSFRQPGDFTISTFTPGQTYKYAEGKTSNKIANNVPSSFKQVIGLYTPTFLNTDTTLTLSFEPAFEAPGYLQVSIPSYFTVPTSLSCSQVANFNGACTSISSHTIRVNGQFTSNGLITFQITGFKSTIRAPTSVQYIILTSFTSDNFQLDYSSDQITYLLSCTLPCRTCDSLDPTLCDSCYDNIDITDKIIFDLNSRSCYSKCPDGRYENPTSNLCEDCNINCLTCERQATFCTSCKQTTAFKYLNIKSINEQICVSQCQQKMYPDTTKTPPTCVNCVSPCQTCTNLNFCLTCLDTFYFWENSCSPSCPLGSTVGNDVTGNCQVCSTNCLTCQITVDSCTSCVPQLILYEKKCISQCQLPLVYRSDILTCGPCDVQCRTCQKIASNCTSCDPTSQFKYYLINDCLKQCPDLYFQAVSICTLCSTMNMNCDFCINSTYCERCNTGYLFFQGLCLDTTPSGYVNISGFARPCQGDCETCQVTQTNCTSCKTLNLIGNSCQATCPAGTIAINKQCTSCLSPCRTCTQNTNNCTSCDTTLVPQLYLIENKCQIECPMFYYTDQGTSKCLPCQIPCKKCTNLVTCITCDENYFLYQGISCISNCPLKFIGINRICEPCVAPCRTCVDSTTKCLSCQQDYFYFNSTNKCVSDCGQGLYEQFLNRTCISCTAPCRTCTNTTDTCLSCLTGILYNFQCIFQCPRKMYNDTNVCQDCPQQCSSCASRVLCTNCTSNFVLYNDFCIAKCPDTHAVIVAGACTKCSSTNCHKCYDNDLCYNCVSDYSLLNGACLSNCPAGYVTNGTHCQQVLASTLESSNNNMFPVPLSIGASVVLIACMMSKLQNYKTFLAGAIYALLGIIETLALLYYIYLYYVGLYADYPIGIYIAVGALGLLYLLNFLSVIQSIILCYDKKHAQWKDSSAMNKLYNGFSTLVGLVVSHKFKNLMFSRLFAFIVFSAPLEDTKKFKIFNIFSFISLIHSGAAIFSVITIIKLADPETQFFHACLDVLIVTGLNIIVAFFNAMKGDDFFNQVTPQGLMLNRVIFGDEDSYNEKISADGNDIEVQEGQGYYSKIQHTLGSHQPFKYKQSDESRQDLHSAYEADSLTNIEQEKGFESVSVQAYDMLNEKQHQQTGIDFSTLKVDKDSNDISKFTTIFQNEDKSIQNTIENDKKKVDFSVQKYNDVSLVDRSLQGNEGLQKNNNDVSIQYSNRLNSNLRDVSIQRSHQDNKHDISVQGSLQNLNRNDISVQGTVKYTDQSGQYSYLQSQKGVQKIVMLNDRSMQQSVDKQSWAGQNTIDVKDMSVQKESQQIEYNEFNETLDQNDDTTLKNTDNIFYIDEEENEDEDGLQSVARQKTEKTDGRQLYDKKKTIGRQQLAEQKQEEFDFPPEQIKSYEQQLEQKILAKQKELERVRREVEIKERESQLKQKLMSEEKQRLQKQLNETSSKNHQLEHQAKQQQELIKVNQQKQQLLKQNQHNQQALAKSKPKQLLDKSTMMRMVQLVDDATSIDHYNNVQSQSLPQTPYLQQQQAQNNIQQKIQTMKIVHKVEQGTSMDDQQLFLSGQLLNRPKKDNYEVDMNVYIKEKSEYELNDQSNLDEQKKSIKTKAKPSTRRKAKVDHYQTNRQMEVKSTKKPSLPLNLQSQQPFIQSSSGARFQKQPGKIKVIDDLLVGNQEKNIIEFQQPQEDEINYEKTQNYIYEVQDRSLDQQEEDLALESLQANQRNSDHKNDMLNRNNYQKKQQQNQRQQQSQHDEINQRQQLPQTQRIEKTKLILDQSKADQQLKDEDSNQQQQFLIHQQLDQINDEYFDSSQDIPAGLLLASGQKKNTQSDAEDYIAKRHKHKRVLSKEQQLKQVDAKQLADRQHQQLKKSFNDQRKKLQRSDSHRKKIIPPQNKETLHVNISKLNSYQVDNHKHSSYSISPQKKASSNSLLANAAKNLVMNANESRDNQNDVLIRKNSFQKNPLVTQKKWEHQKETPNNLYSIEQSSEGNNDSFLQGHNKKPLNRRQQPPTAPLQTDKQETSFSHQAHKVGSSHNINTYNQINNRPSSKSINEQSRRKTSMQKLLGEELIGRQAKGSSYAQQVEVHFEKQQQQNPSNSDRKVSEHHDVARPRVNQPAFKDNSSSRPFSTSKQRHHIASRPPTKPSTMMKQYESQQIFGEEYNQQSDEEYSEPNSFDKKISKQHRNNLILDKMMERPDNDDLYEYYNRASTKKGNNKRGSKERKSGSNNHNKINLSKDKQENDRKMEKVYMQRLDSSMNQYQRNASRSRGRY